MLKDDDDDDELVLCLNLRVSTVYEKSLSISFTSKNSKTKKMRKKSELIKTNCIRIIAITIIIIIKRFFFNFLK